MVLNSLCGSQQGRVGVMFIGSSDETKRQALGLTRQGCSLMSQKQALPICLPLCTPGLTPRRPEPMAHRCASLAPSISEEPILWSAHVIPTRAEWGRDSAAGGPCWACTPSLLYIRPVASSPRICTCWGLNVLWKSHVSCPTFYADTVNVSHFKRQQHPTAQVGSSVSLAALSSPSLA